MNTELAKTDKRDKHGAMTGSETRQIVTPYAFNVAPDLFGTPLASPFRRATALLIDLFFVALLTNVSSVFWAIMAAVMFFRAGGKVKKKSRFRILRKILKLLAAFFLFVFVLAFMDEIMPDDDDVASYSVNEEKDDIGGMAALDAVTLTAKYAAKISNTHSAVSAETCLEATACWSDLGNAFATDLASSRIDENEARELFTLIKEGAQEQLSKQEVDTLVETMSQRFDTLRESSADELVVSDPESKTAIENDEEETSSEYDGIFKWVITIADDLGLGFGWAAFYFTALTTWFQGRTIGKRLMGIRVIKLDNKRINLWESFERYGGYAAGLVTGLLGFLQVFWDPNRQAIQDKICETLVIDTRKPKVDLELIENGKSLTPSA